MIKPLYDFKAGDEVWVLGQPGVYGTIFSIYRNGNNTVTIVSMWKNKHAVIRKDYISVDKYRPRYLSTAEKPYSYGAMRHTDIAK